MSDVVVRAEHVSKMFKVYKKPYDRMLEWATLGNKKLHDDFWALKDISFLLKRGEALGIVGPNGAGKSTLLKILTGSLVPTTGKVKIDGRVVSLLELGTGFHPELTGLQNIYNSTSLLGFEPSFIHNKLDEITEFAGIGDFIHRPVKSYSSGMYVRLAFSLFAHLDPEIYIVDEALAVGDVFFQQKCYAKLEEMRKQGVSIILVSHDPAPIVNFCDYAMIIDKGQLLESGEPSNIIDVYQAKEYAKKTQSNNYDISIKDGNLAYGDQSVEIINVVLYSNEQEKNAFHSGETVSIAISLKHTAPIQEPKKINVGIQIKNRFGTVVYGTNTYWNGIDIYVKDINETIDCVFTTNMNLGPGEYTITVAASEARRHVENVYHWIENIVKFTVMESPKPTFGGQVMLPVMINVSRSEREAHSGDIQ